MPATAAWLASVEALLNRSLDASAEAGELTRPLRGTALDVDVAGWMRIRCAAGDGRVSLQASDDGSADAVISGSPLELLKLLGEGRIPVPRAGTTAAARSANSAAAMRSAPATISGNAEVANLYRRLLERARPDLEEELSRWIGDFPARRVALAARGALGYLRRAAGIARENVAEYLQEESRDLVNRTELEEFLQGVDQARETADRIDARIARMEARLRDSR